MERVESDEMFGKRQVVLRFAAKYVTDEDAPPEANKAQQSTFAKCDRLGWHMDVRTIYRNPAAGPFLVNGIVQQQLEIPRPAATVIECSQVVVVVVLHMWANGADLAVGEEGATPWR